MALLMEGYAASRLGLPRLRMRARRCRICPPAPRESPTPGLLVSRFRTSVTHRMKHTTAAPTVKACMPHSKVPVSGLEWMVSRKWPCLAAV